MLIDTHAHLDYEDFAADFAAVLERARAAGVDRIITIGTSAESSRRAVELAVANPAVHAVVGIHPTTVDEAADGDYSVLRELAAHPRVAAIGEAGLDYHRLPENPPEAAAVKVRQAASFRRQLDLAADLGLNVVIHQRDAWEDTLAILARYTGRLRGVFHCFGGTPAQAAEVMALGHLVSFTGIVTFKNGAAVRETAASLPTDRFMVETDCPYLAPVPFRGKRCEPAHTRETALAVAQARGETLEAVAAQTTATAERFFRLG
ncbi:MAG: TatD family hydrolase [Gluconacetobacter diazotrophicus]|nr:TatD family hydrolase [Gluconacetobacter diazotrophicus]